MISSIFKFFALFIVIQFSYGNDIDLFDNKNCGNNTLLQEESNCFQEISVEKAKKLYDKKVIFIDGRSNFLYKKSTIKGAINIPVDHYLEKRELLVDYTDREFVIFCSGITCGKSAELANIMYKDGFKKIYVLTEGFPKWKSDGLPINEDKSIEDPYRLGEKEFHIASKDATIVDVRTKEEYNSGHFSKAVNIPIKQDPKDFIQAMPKGKTLILICATGMRAYDGVALLVKNKKFTVGNIFYFDGDVVCDKHNNCKFTEFVE